MSPVLAIAGCLWSGWSADLIFEDEYFGSVVGAVAEELEFKPLIVKPDDPLRMSSEIDGDST
jgi:hypothetical protein